MLIVPILDFASSSRLGVDPAERRSRAVHEEFTQVAIPAFTDPQQMRLASSRMLAWHEPEPGRQLPAILDVCRIVDRCHQSRGR
jgi:hypothetical protein